MKKICILSSVILLSMNISAQKPTYITGIVDDSIERLVIGYYDCPFIETEFNPLQSKRIPNERNIIAGQLFTDTFQTVSLSLRYSTGEYSRMQSVFITPGDSVSFVNDIVDGMITLKFSGRNSAHYNFGYQLFAKFGSNPFFRKGNDIRAYKDTITQILSSKYAFLEDYVKDNPVSKEFYDYAKASLLNEYIWRLYVPLYGQIKKEDIPDGYFDRNIRPVNELADNYPVNVLNFYFDSYKKENWNDLDTLYSFVKTNFSGREREYMVSALIGMFAYKQMPDYQSQLLSIIKEAQGMVKDSVYLDYIDRAHQFYALVNNPFPEAVLSKTSLKEYGQNKPVSLEAALKKYEGKPVFIDFWASWCGPCIGDIEDSQEAKAYLKEKGVEYVYIASGETDEKKWDTAVKRLQIGENQFLLLDSKNSPLKNYLKIKAIPRYVILDANHKIINANTPRPVPQSLAEFKKNIEKCFAKTVTFY